VLWLAIAIVLLSAIAVITGVRARLRREAALAEQLEIAPVRRVLEIRPLPEGARDRYLETWTALQSQFDLEPEMTIRQSDRLVQEMMRERGYPTGDFGRVSEELSAEEAEIINNYRLAHRISVKAETDLVPLEQAQQAATALRAVFARLVAEAASEPLSET